MTLLIQKFPLYNSVSGCKCSKQPLVLLIVLCYSLCFSLFAGYIYNRIHVFGFSEAVPEAHQEEREKASIASVEEVVHPNSLSIKVIKKSIPANTETRPPHLLRHDVVRFKALFM